MSLRERIHNCLELEVGYDYWLEQRDILEVALRYVYWVSKSEENVFDVILRRLFSQLSMGSEEENWGDLSTRDPKRMMPIASILALSGYTLEDLERQLTHYEE